MDPLSISMSILTTIGAARATLAAAKSVYNAPEEIESLLNDLTEGELMVRDIKAYLGEPEENLATPQVMLLRERLVESEGILFALKTLMQELLVKPENPKGVNRLAWFKVKKKTRKLANKLSRIHEDLPRRLAQIEGSRIKLELKNLSLIQSHTKSGLSRLESLVEGASQSVADLHEAYGDLQLNISDRFERLDSTLAANLANCNSLETLEWTTMSSGSRQLFEGVQKGLSTGAAVVDNRESNSYAYRSIAIESRYQPPNCCSATCRCRCHIKRTVETPSFLSRILGHLFVGYKGLPMISRSCTEARCTRAFQPSVYATYYFPVWWVARRMIILMGEWTSITGLRVALSFPRLICNHSQVMSFAQSGNVEGLKSLFLDGQASPNDVVDIKIGGDCGSVISHAIIWRQWAAFKFLLHAGADTSVEDKRGRTVEIKACEMYLMGKLPDDVGQLVLSFFRRIDFGFSGLHESVLRLRYTTLPAEIARLSLTPSTINDLDEFGRTALWWACARGDRDTVLFLLEAGANPNLPEDPDNETPLHASIQFGTVDCATELLKFGVRPRGCYDADCQGSTTLNKAIFYLRPLPEEFLEELLQMGVNIGCKDAIGFNSLATAICKVEHTAIRWLLKNGVDYRDTALGSSMLHWLARWGDLEAIRIVRNASWSHIDINAKDVNNLTPMEFLLGPNRPKPDSKELIESFTQLLNEIEARTKYMDTLIAGEVSMNFDKGKLTAMVGDGNIYDDSDKLGAFLDDSDTEDDSTLYESLELQHCDSSNLSNMDEGAELAQEIAGRESG